MELSLGEALALEHLYCLFFLAPIRPYVTIHVTAPAGRGVWDSLEPPYPGMPGYGGGRGTSLSWRGSQPGGRSCPLAGGIWRRAPGASPQPLPNQDGRARLVEHARQAAIGPGNLGEYQRTDNLHNCELCGHLEFSPRFLILVELAARGSSPAVAVCELCGREPGPVQRLRELCLNR